MGRLLKAAMIPWYGFLVIGVVLLIVGGLQAGVAYTIQAHTVASESVPCTVTSLKPGTERITAKLDCGGDERQESSTQFVYDYYTYPGKPVRCHLMKAPGIADCFVQKPEEVSSEG